MLQDNNKKPARKIRVERQVQLHMEEGESHLWAVSYADLLMVILSFFVIFFSQNEEVEKNIIQQILTETTGGASSSNSGKGSGFERNSGNYERAPSAYIKADNQSLDKEKLTTSLELLANKLKPFKVTSYKKADSIVFQLPENVFGLKKYSLNSQSKKQLKLLMERLDPYMDLIDIIVVGHSDTTPVLLKDQDQLIQNNFDLSNLRAGRALRYIMSIGIPKERLFTYADAGNKRNTRSLSILIKPRGELL